MITLSTLFIVLYSYSVYNIRKRSGSWKEFNPFNGNPFSYGMFMLGTAVLVGLVLIGIAFMAYIGLIP